MLLRKGSIRHRLRVYVHSLEQRDSASRLAAHATHIVWPNLMVQVCKLILWHGVICSSSPLSCVKAQAAVAVLTEHVG